MSRWYILVGKHPIEVSMAVTSYPNTLKELNDLKNESNN